ncbi:MAG TPA: CmcJ/NvfI family oxidoreductase [Sphingomonas sp.]|uniref:CmcJ/NvfI family oxidoreductase n=1 Tax=Sphingomonas sp. TaxID=28214 RepID=UPI002CDFABD2|nr:CmcJ/NvfI family oxidoreductase [Sphingomonas sp.]HMI20663.1 CmcJ/NvfI family oxidoreductase [Sphingomonas sp.]
MIETQLRGQFPSDFRASERINLSELMRNATGRAPQNPPTRILDARALQAEATSEADFLAEHGFVLLDSPTRVTDWGNADQVAQHYMPEVEAMIRECLYPGRKLIVQQPPNVMRRGAGTSTPQYGLGVHSDHGTTADDFQRNVEAFTTPDIGAKWRAWFERDEVEGFVSLDFWRTTGMDGPLKHMPLALCDPTSVDGADIIPTALEGIAPGGAATHHVSLAHNPGQRWYYYPDMEAHEVLVFKLFQLMRNEEPQPYRACFHSAVEDPAAPADAQPRQSCEHRVSVMLLRD